VLGESRHDLHVRDIHAAVEILLGERVSASSVRDSLARNSRGSRVTLERVSRGRYRVAAGAPEANA